MIQFIGQKELLNMVMIIKIIYVPAQCVNNINLGSMSCWHFLLCSGVYILKI